MTEIERLRDLLDAGHVKLGVHIRKMNSPGSPVFRQAENVWPAASILGASFGCTMLVHYYLGFAVLLVGAWLWLTRLLPRIKDGVYDRTAALVLSSETAFDVWWSKGVLSLYAKLPDGTERAATRKESWRDWVMALPESLLVRGTAGETPAASRLNIDES